MGQEDEIKLIAYKIWEEEGYIDRNDWEHWFRAEVMWEEQQKQKPVTRGTNIASKKGTEKSTRARVVKKRSHKT